MKGIRDEGDFGPAGPRGATRQSAGDQAPAYMDEPDARQLMIVAVGSARWEDLTPAGRGQPGSSMPASTLLDGLLPSN